MEHDITAFGKNSFTIRVGEHTCLIEIWDDEYVVYAPAHTMADHVGEHYAAYIIDDTGDIREAAGYTCSVDGHIGDVDVIGDQGRLLAQRALTLWTDDERSVDRFTDRRRSTLLARQRDEQHLINQLKGAHAAALEALSAAVAAVAAQTRTRNALEALGVNTDNLTGEHTGRVASTEEHGLSHP